MGETASARRRSWHAAPRPRLSVMNSLVASSSACRSPSVAAQVKPASTGGSASGWNWRILASGRTRVARQLVTRIHLTMTMVAASDSCEADGVTRLSDSHNIDGVGRSKAEQVTGGERMGGGEERRRGARPRRPAAPRPRPLAMGTTSPPVPPPPPPVRGRSSTVNEGACRRARTELDLRCLP
jgi:hypothetical protein